jgi:hypothetical protein
VLCLVHILASPSISACYSPMDTGVVPPPASCSDLILIHIMPLLPRRRQQPHRHSNFAIDPSPSSTAGEPPKPNPHLFHFSSMILSETGLHAVFYTL